MQINSNLPAVLFSPKPVDTGSNRVVINPAAEGEFLPAAQRRSVSPVTQTVQPANASADSQQARFIRTLASIEREVSANATGRMLPPPVQAYLQIASLNTNRPAERLIDERV